MWMGPFINHRDTIASPKPVDGSFKRSLCSQLQHEQSALLIPGKRDKEKAAVSRDSSAHVWSLEDVNLKAVLAKYCFCGKKTCGGCILGEESSCPVVAHSSRYLRCPTALVRTSERMM